MTNRTSDVSAAVRETGQRAVRVRESSDLLARNVAALKHGVVHAVRTSTQDVDRRRDQRYAIELVGRLALADGQSHAVRLVDLSVGGARLANGPDLPAQTHGTLHLEAVPFPLPFVVAGGTGGLLRLTFMLDDAAIARLGQIVERAAMRNAA
jgi:hypothetical protein